jgi:hypothetical protein
MDIAKLQRDFLKQVKQLQTLTTLQHKATQGWDNIPPEYSTLVQEFENSSKALLASIQNLKQQI